MVMLESRFPGLPIPASEGDGVNAPFWSWLRRHELRLLRCSTCGLTRTPATPQCHQCYGRAADWVRVPAVGTVYSWTRVWHASTGGVVGRTPYLVVWVEVDHPDRPRFLGNLLGEPLQDVTIGAPVVGVFEDYCGGTLLNWVLR
jgi:uncharacterized OB-fold protein